MCLEDRWSKSSFSSLGLPNLSLIDKFGDLCVPSTVDFPLLAIQTFWARLAARFYLEGQTWYRIVLALRTPEHLPALKPRRRAPLA